MMDKGLGTLIFSSLTKSRTDQDISDQIRKTLLEIACKSGKE